MGNILGIGVSGLQIAQANLLTTSHNISNADTPGYNRQEVIQGANRPLGDAGGFVGRGVHSSTVQRIYSQFLATQSLQVQSESSQLDSHYAQIQQIDNLLADENSGLSPALQNFFSAVQDVATNPASVPSRQALLSNAESLASRFHGLEQRLSDISTGLNAQITSDVNEINSIAKQIAKLNNNILLAQGAANGQPANDLLDQRDALTSRLSQLINTDVVQQSDGAYNVFIGSGQALVVGTQTQSLKAVNLPDDPSKLSIGIISGDNAIILPENQISGGSLGGVLAFRGDTLDQARNALGRVAIGLAQTFNDQHRLGQDLNGNLGSDFFTIPSPEVISNNLNNTASDITADITDVNALTTSDYRFDYDGSNYTLTRLSDNTSTSSPTLPSVGTPLVLDGLSITSASINADESFLIRPTVDGARSIAVNIHDTSEIAAAAPIRTNAELSNTGTGTISAGTVNPLPIDANLQQPVTITFHTPADGQFDVSGIGAGLPATNQVYTAGDDISFNGFAVQINGNPAAGDIFTIEPNNNGSADNRNALLLGALQTQNTLSGGTSTYQSAYGKFVSQIGNKARELEVTSKAQANLVAQTERSIQSLSGVNLDEEAANLIRYQQAYQASSKVIEIASRLFDTILRIG